MEHDSIMDTMLDFLEISVRARNVLRHIGVQTIGDLMQVDSAQLASIRNIGAGTIGEIQSLQQLYMTKEDTIDPVKQFNEWMILKSVRQKIKEYFTENDIELARCSLSTRAFRVLAAEDITMFSQLVMFTPNIIAQLSNLGTTSIEEIKTLINFRIRQNKQEILAYCKVQGTKQLSIKPSIQVMMLQQSNREKIASFIKVYDASINELDISTKLKKYLLKHEFLLVSDLIIQDEHYLHHVSKIHLKYRQMIDAAVQKHLKKYELQILAFCNGEMDSLYNVDYIKSRIFKAFDKVGFEGFSFTQLRELFPIEISDDMIKHTITECIEEQTLEYVDYRCYRNYPSFFEFAESLETKQVISIKLLRKKWEGKSLREIGKEEGITGERVRQLIEKTTKIIQKQLSSIEQCSYFSDDYYAYLYKNYDISKEFLLDYCNESGGTIFYLNAMYDKGKTSLQEGLKDPLLSIFIKHNIQRYCRKKYVLLDRTWVYADRSSVEAYVLKHYCNETQSYDSFIDTYNTVLQQNRISDCNLLITDKVKATRIEQLKELPNCLWTTGKQIRFYDIERYDFAWFLEEINLNQYHNIKISTAKLMIQNEQLMQNYDIRNENELHAILRAIVDSSNYTNNIRFTRMPHIQFGIFDMDTYLLELIKSYGPITSKDLFELVHTELGIQTETLQASASSTIQMYNHQGVYSADIEKLESAQLTLLETKMEEDAYSIDEAKTIFLDAFPNLSSSFFNPFNLKQLGFQVYSNLILRNYSSLDDFYRLELQKEDTLNIIEFIDKYEWTNSLSNTLQKLKKSYDLIEFQPRQFINMRKLERAGYQKRDLIRYCDEVYENVDKNQFFTIYSLQESGQSFKLDELGFEPMFYASILAQDDRFSVVRMFNQAIFYPKKKTTVTSSMFYQSLVNEVKSIELYDLIDILQTTYGCKGIEQHKIISSIKDTEMVYHPIMEKIYMNEQCYHAEFDEGAL